MTSMKGGSDALPIASKAAKIAKTDERDFMSALMVAWIDRPNFWGTFTAASDTDSRRKRLCGDENWAGKILACTRTYFNDWEIQSAFEKYCWRREQRWASPSRQRRLSRRPPRRWLGQHLLDGLLPDSGKLFPSRRIGVDFIQPVAAVSRRIRVGSDQRAIRRNAM